VDGAAVSLRAEGGRGVQIQVPEDLIGVRKHPGGQWVVDLEGVLVGGVLVVREGVQPVAIGRTVADMRTHARARVVAVSAGSPAKSIPASRNELQRQLHGQVKLILDRLDALLKRGA
jgi:hypothetical protein